MQIYFLHIKISEQTWKFDEIVVNRKDASKQGIALDVVESSRILVSDKFAHSEDGFKHFIGYLHVDNVFRPLCIILPPMSGYVKYFDNGRKNMSFLTDDESVYLKYSKILNKIKKLLGVNFRRQPIHDDKYIKTKVKSFGGTINTVFSNNKVPKAKNDYIFIAAVCVVLKTEGKNHPQVYLEQCKYKEKQKELVDLIGDEVNLSFSDTDDLDE